ncbi:hypothetical protein KBTX_00486 [wastewater metagenome]|uniref:Prepilin-type N-terminal cleavage/methylation domain-containing protein n=3 Tax=root TaxID=1 RepID=A0A5B8R9Y1_9ZZZZ|nr:hypothetical protein KBTEX_00486 [uncultured organism]
MQNLKQRPSRAAGFTLVEMAIVLAVIGLILGAIAIAEDVQRNAEYTKIANKFLYQWKEAYDQYYQRTGVVLGDCQQAPTYMVNGAETTFTGSDGDVCERQSAWSGGSGAAGIPANFDNTGLRVCNGAGYGSGAGSDNTGGAGLAEQNLRDLMLRAGIGMPPGRGEGFEDRYLYEDTNGNSAEVQVCFQWNPEGTPSGAGNVMVVRGLTPDLARFIDQLIDGSADAREGRFRIQAADQADDAGGANAPGYEWEANNTYSQANNPTVGGGGPDSQSFTGETADETDDALDEDRVALLTAHWTMGQ